MLERIKKQKVLNSIIQCEERWKGGRNMTRQQFKTLKWTRSLIFAQTFQTYLLLVLNSKNLYMQTIAHRNVWVFLQRKTIIILVIISSFVGFYYLFSHVRSENSKITGWINDWLLFYETWNDWISINHFIMLRSCHTIHSINHICIIRNWAERILLEQIHFCPFNSQR